MTTGVFPKQILPAGWLLYAIGGVIIAGSAVTPFLSNLSPAMLILTCLTSGAGSLCVFWGWRINSGKARHLTARIICCFGYGVIGIVSHDPSHGAIELAIPIAFMITGALTAFSRKQYMEWVTSSEDAKTEANSINSDTDATLQCIDSILAGAPTFGADAVAPFAKRDATKIFASGVNTGSTINMSHRQLAMMLIMNNATDQLLSCQHHIYRGVLSGVGKEVLAVWNVAATGLIGFGYWTQEQMDQEGVTLRARIAEEG